ncbi:uncharacterized protein LOC125032725 [Penaeus chinensis]|uniref:uncharacterized protein LOC125032725 n=1 Tax=Penaeus chinensis TaxID=139456 RepID=UPI001FB777C9|nr:uncharacterized protein LOC125032725 [Penaeus chinensis]XP_047479976.1 uncharacterized protein LOC125032725 [Penaeus chinensis]
MASRHACLSFLHIVAFMSTATLSTPEKPLLVNYKFSGNSLREYIGNSSFSHISRADLPNRIFISMCWESHNPHCTVHAIASEKTLGYLCHNATTQYIIKYKDESNCRCSDGNRSKGPRLYHDVFTDKTGPKWSIIENRTGCETSEFVQSEQETHSIIVYVYKDKSIDIPVCTNGIIPYKGYMSNREVGARYIYLEKEGVNITYPIFKCQLYSMAIKEKNLSQVIDEYNLSVSNGEETQVASLHNISIVVNQMKRERITTSTQLSTPEEPNHLSLSVLTDPSIISGTFASKASVSFVVLAFCAGQFGRPYI